MITLNTFKKGINPHSIPYSDIVKGKSVVVDIPIDHDGSCAEVEGVISKELWIAAPNCIYSQINITRQNTKKDIVCLGCGLYAIYPENIKKLS